MARRVAGAARGSLGLLALGLVFGLAYLTAIRPAYVLAYALGMLWVLAWAWPRAAARGLTLERTLAAGPAAVGEAFEETFRLRKRGRVPAPWVEVTDLGEAPGSGPGRVVSLGRAPVTWSVRGVYRRRGWVTFGPTRLRVGEPFGLCSREVSVDHSHRLLVYPRIRRLPELRSGGPEPGGDAQAPGGWADQPPETAGIREYAAGDAFARVHWPLSQRHQRLMSRTFEQPRSTDLWLVLDLDCRAHQGEGEESTLEYAVSLAASVAVQLPGRGHRVGLIANDARATMLRPHPGGGQGRLILDYLALAQPDGAGDLGGSPVWDRLRRLPRRAVVVITPSPPGGWIDALRSVGGREASLLAFWLEPSSFVGPPEPGGSRAVPRSGPEPDRLGPASEIVLYVVRRGDDVARLVGRRDAARIA